MNNLRTNSISCQASSFPHLRNWMFDFPQFFQEVTAKMTRHKLTPQKRQTKTV